MASVFPRSSIFVVDGDMLMKQPHIEMQKLEEFLGLSSFYEGRHFYFSPENGGELPCFSLPEKRCMGKDKGLAHPPLREETLCYLRGRLKPLMEKFKNETGVEVRL